MPLTLNVRLMTPTAMLPTRGSALAAGYDLYADQATVIPARGRAKVTTGIQLELVRPVSEQKDASFAYMLKLQPRSGLSVKGIDIGAGVVDEDYRGQVMVIMINGTDQPIAVAVGDRICQMVINKVYTPAIELVTDLSETTRGDGGFGSTGV